MTFQVDFFGVFFVFMPSWSTVETLGRLSCGGINLLVTEAFFGSTTFFGINGLCLDVGFRETMTGVSEEKRSLKEGSWMVSFTAGSSSYREKRVDEDTRQFDLGFFNNFFSMLYIVHLA